MCGGIVLSQKKKVNNTFYNTSLEQEACRTVTRQKKSTLSKHSRLRMQLISGAASGTFSAVHVQRGARHVSVTTVFVHAR